MGRTSPLLVPLIISNSFLCEPCPRRSFGKVFKGVRLSAQGEETDQFVAIKIVAAEQDAGEVRREERGGRQEERRKGGGDGAETGRRRGCGGGGEEAEKGRRGAERG